MQARKPPETAEQRVATTFPRTAVVPELVRDTLEPAQPAATSTIATTRTALDIQAHSLQEVALCTRGNRARHFRGGSDEIVDQRIERDLHVAPCAFRTRKAHSLALNVSLI